MRARHFRTLFQQQSGEMHNAYVAKATSELSFCVHAITLSAGAAALSSEPEYIAYSNSLSEGMVVVLHCSDICVFIVATGSLDVNMSLMEGPNMARMAFIILAISGSSMSLRSPVHVWGV